MREILFRGKRKDNGEWVQGSLFAEGTRFEIVRGTCNNVGIEGVEVIPETIGQYTGLTDKKGNKVFEGDVVKSLLGTYAVKFLIGSWCCSLIENEYLTLLSTISINEVIGNVHDNHELLGGK